VPLFGAALLGSLLQAFQTEDIPMRKAILFLAVFGLAGSLFLMPLSAVAQTKITGSLDCEKADPMHVIQIPEREGFSYVIAQYKCAWDASVDELKTKDYLNIVFSEVMGASVRTTSTGVARYSNGDRLYSHNTGTRDPKTLTSTGKWTYTLGTGKLRGIKGEGTYTCKRKSAEPDAGITCTSAGEYTLPAAKK
jgi:hypothetical protein